MREEAVHIWPESCHILLATACAKDQMDGVLLVTIDFTAAAAVVGRSASSKTISGDFPPSSSATALRFDRAAACMIARPALVDPVKLIFLEILRQLYVSQV